MFGVGGRGSRGAHGTASLLVLLLGLWLLATEAFTGTAAQTTATKNQCYKFTWIKDKNSTDCDEEKESGIPCEEPFIRTNPPNLPPNISQIDDQCSASLACPPYKCDREKEQCLRYVIYDVNNKPQYMTLFCGEMVDVTKGSNPGIKGCFWNKNGTSTIEACSCYGNMCNTATSLRSWELTTGLLMAVVAVVYGATSGY